MKRRNRLMKMIAAVISRIGMMTINAGAVTLE